MNSVMTNSNSATIPESIQKTMIVCMMLSRYAIVVLLFVLFVYVFKNEL